jgi:hypothetical protein
MSDEIPPALSPEEWADVESNEIGSSVYRPGVYCTHLFPRHRVNFAGGDDDGVIQVGNDDAPFVMALANAALPDGSPYKITRDDVEEIGEAYEHYRDMQAPGYRAFQRLAAKLAALLPPR